MKHLAVAGGAALCGVVFLGAVVAQEATFGQDNDVEFAASLWSAMESAGLAGDDAIHVRGYMGTEPHGAILETLYMNDFAVQGVTGQLIIKRNYMGEGVSTAAVWEDPQAFYDSVTVMLEDPNARSGWFWAKYTPDGELTMTPADVSMAGQVMGCISCHNGAAGDDMVFAND